jgi:hypothetical protein
MWDRKYVSCLLLSDGPWGEHAATRKDTKGRERASKEDEDGDGYMREERT